MLTFLVLLAQALPHLRGLHLIMSRAPNAPLVAELDAWDALQSLCSEAEWLSEEPM